MISLFKLEIVSLQFILLEDYASSEGTEEVNLKAGDQIEVLHCHGNVWTGRTLSYRKRAIGVGFSLVYALSVPCSRCTCSVTHVGPL